MSLHSKFSLEKYGGGPEVPSIVEIIAVILLWSLVSRVRTGLYSYLNDRIRPLAFQIANEFRKERKKENDYRL